MKMWRVTFEGQITKNYVGELEEVLKKARHVENIYTTRNLDGRITLIELLGETDES